MRLTVAFVPLFVVLSLFASAQTIDSLRTTKQVLAFLNARREINLDSISVGYNDRVRSDRLLIRLAQEFDAPTFSKADIDQNGYTDLLFNGKCILDMDLSIIVMAFGADSFQVKNLGYREHHLLAARLLEMEGRYYLRTLLFNYKYHHNKQRFEHILRYDTLQYSCGEFMEKGTPEEHTIDSIKYYDNASPLRQDFAFSLFFRKDSVILKTTAGLKHFEPDSPTGTFTCLLNRTVRQNLEDYLRHLRFTTLQDQYPSSAVCVGGSVLKIYYSNGKEKRIESGGMQGTFGLTALYSLLWRLRETLPWKLIDPEQFYDFKYE